jgi:hypothetical protein
MILETKKAALPDMHHVIGDVGSGKPPVKDGYARLSNGHILSVNVGNAFTI